jgi:hypothetical protein
MKITEAIRILGIYQKWRLGADFQMIPPNKVTEAINVILDELKNKKDTDDDRLSNFGSSFLAD